MIQPERLKALYASDTTARVLFEHLARRQRDRSETTVDRLLVQLSEHGIRRSDLIRVLRGLEDLGCGRYIEGRWGYKSRFQWEVSLTSVGKVACGQQENVEPLGPPDEAADVDVDVEEETDEGIRHIFHLRPSWTIELVLPEDFSTKEAERLSAFIKALPFEQP